MYNKKDRRTEAIEKSPLFIHYNNNNSISAESIKKMLDEEWDIWISLNFLHTINLLIPE